jgi:uncharacterized repeat protein (TIGR03803 family)
MTTRPRSTRYLLLFSCALATLGLLIILASAPAAAQTYTVIHTFAAGGPQAGITVDAGGNLYGTTLGSLCPSDCGTVFKLEHKSEGWIFSQLYAFQGGSDSAFPQAEVVIGPDGALYGTTAGGEQGGCEQGCGTVFRLTPPPTFCASVSCPWTKTILHTFTNAPDGNGPVGGTLFFDQQGNLYGTTFYGGYYGTGAVFKLARTNGGWTESIIYSFTGLADGRWPVGGVMIDGAGNLYGTTSAGGDVNLFQLFYGYGVIYKISPNGSGWSETVLHTFYDEGDGALPEAVVTMDSAGNLLATSAAGGNGSCAYGVFNGCGIVLRNADVIYGFTGHSDSYPGGPKGPVTLDSAGNIYGTSFANGQYGGGVVFKLSAGQYTYTSLYDFDPSEGYVNPIGKISFDNNGNLYGVTTSRGAVWEITP